MHPAVTDKAPLGSLSWEKPSDARPDHRLFLGIWPDEASAASLTCLMERLRREGIMPGWPVDTGRLHLTLFYLGDYAGQIPPDLSAAVRRAAASVKREPFDVVFDRVGGTRRHVLLTSSQDLAPLRSFRAILGVALAEAGVRFRMNAAFMPHVTLSYGSGHAPETRVDPIGWTVREFHFVESLLGQHRYIRLDSWVLGSGGPG